MNIAGFPVIVFELALVVLGVLGFAWWQLRDVASARRQAKDRTQAARDSVGRNESAGS